MSTITSLGIGSGLDLNSLLDQLEEAEREKLKPIAEQKKSYETKISAYGSLEASLAQFKEAAGALNDAELFQAVKSEVSGSALTAAATSEANAGSYRIEVSQQAKAFSVASHGVADQKTPLGAGRLSMTLGGGETLEVEVGEGESSLMRVRDAINDLDADIRASIVNDGGSTPHRLVLSAQTTGTDSAVAGLSVSGALSSGLAFDPATEVSAQNARLNVNGVAIESQTNRVDKAIDGLTLNLMEAGEASVEVSRDRDGIQKAIKSFVDAYNRMQGQIGQMSSFNQETGEAGELLGDSTLRTAESRIRNAMSNGVGEGQGELRMLSDVGVSLQLDGTLKLDPARLDEVVADDVTRLAEFFAGDSEEGGIIGQLDVTLERMLDRNGLMGNAIDGLDQSIRSLDKSHARTEESINATLERYRKEFSELDGMVANMNSTSEYLSQQFDVLSAQAGGKSGKST
ncbi:flagellar filament capping protein FliD [Halomonas sp. YLGW01]|uniref:flagellar filament capping protein FliD n=1 Tax=Halomonas sp. YLGW01 TaxID=2773308 RepID=UPI0017833E85|nr:flagellar filament capping protein FliD [Halomonas sp. YLGW01]